MHMKPLHALMSVTGQKTQAKTRKLHFSTKWPWPLTYDRDHQTCPRGHQGQSLYQILWPYVNWFSLESVHKLTHTHTQTDRQTDRQTDHSVFITSTADAGGNNLLVSEKTTKITGIALIWYKSLLVPNLWKVVQSYFCLYTENTLL